MLGGGGMTEQESRAISGGGGSVERAGRAVSGGGGIAEREGRAVSGGGGTAEQLSAVTGGGGIAEQDGSAVFGGGGMTDPDNEVRGGGGIAEQASAVLGGGGIIDPERSGFSALARTYCPASVIASPSSSPASGQTPDSILPILQLIPPFVNPLAVRSPAARRRALERRARAGAESMIVARNRCYVPISGHDHEVGSDVLA
jgi:hypothetical protein